MKIKKILALVLTASTLLTGLTGCGGSEDTNSAGSGLLNKRKLF